MKLTVLGAAALVGGVLYAYDLHSPALTPVAEKKAPVHADLGLVKGGELQFALVVDRTNPNWGKAFGSALAVLKEAFVRATGKIPEVLGANESARIAAAKYVIAVGDGPIARDLGIDFLKLPDQGFVIRTFARGVAIVGRDTDLDPDWNSHPFDAYKTGTGTLYGAIDFAERFLGVRYYYPSEEGTDVPPCRDLVVRPVSYEDSPWFNTRGANTWYFQGGSMPIPQQKKYFPGLIPGKSAEDLLCRWRCGGTLPGIGGHTPGPVRLAKTHPDKLKTIFYTSANGKFWYAKGSSVGSYFNVFDLRFADLVFDEYRRYYESGGKENPCGVVCNSRAVTFGVCDTAILKDDVLADPFVKETGIVTEKDYAEGYGMANVYGRFLQYLGNRVKNELGGKKLYLLAYCNSEKAPPDPKWALPDNIEVNLCDWALPRRTRDPEAMAKSKKLFADWYRALGNRPAARTWMYSQGGNPFVRAICPEYVAEAVLAHGETMGREGVFFDFDGGKDLWHYFYAVYVCYKAQWNPHLDVEAALDELWQRLYGAEAARHMKEYHRILKEDAYEGVFLKGKSAFPVYPVAVMDGMDRELRAAEAIVKDDPVRMRRLNLVRDLWPDTFAQQRLRASYKPATYAIARLAGKPKMDGVPDEAFWQGLVPVPLMETRFGKTETANHATIRLGYDADGIYGMLETSAKPKVDPRGGLLGNDQLDILMMPGTDKEILYQILVDPADGRYSMKRRFLPISQPPDRSWTAPGFQVVTSGRESRWVAEFFIPFSLFESGAAKPGDVWNFNIVWSKMLGERERLGNSFTMGNNQNTGMFAFVRFE